MPTPRRGESRSDFVSRCIPEVIDDGTAQDPEQAVAVCNSIWEQEHPTAAQEVTTETEPEWRAIHRAADAAVAPMARVVVRAMKAAQDAVKLQDIRSSVERGAASMRVFEAVNAADDILSAELPHAMFDVLVQGAFAAGRVARSRGGFIPADPPDQDVPGPIDPLTPVGKPLLAHGGLSSIFIPGQDGRPGFTLTPDFEVNNPEASNWAATKSSADITRISNKTRLAIQRQINRAFVEGFPVEKAARNIRRSIGLLPAQTDAVSAFEVEMRARRRGRGIRRAGKTFAGPRTVPRGGYTEQQIARAVTRYEDRLLAQRALNIARTETIAASNEGQRQLWLQAQKAGALPADVERIWIVTPDDALCPVCRGMIGQRTTLNGTFSTGRFGPVKGPPAHPSCRCATGLVRKNATRRGPARPPRPDPFGRIDRREDFGEFKTAAGKTRLKNFIRRGRGDLRRIQDLNGLSDMQVGTLQIQDAAQVTGFGQGEGLAGTYLKPGVLGEGDFISVALNANRARIKDVLTLGDWTVNASARGTLLHELGHGVFSRRIVSTTKRRWTDIFRKLNRNPLLIEDNISVYATTNAEELFAESFSAWAHPKYRRGSLPKEIEEFLDNLLTATGADG